ncbi:MAG: glycosyltransferase, partial [Candidatus Eisenbacteria bacterium]
MISRALFVAFSGGPRDGRLRWEAEALAASGAVVDVLCLREKGEKAVEVVRGARYIRLPVRRPRGGLVRDALGQLAFFLLAFAAASVLAIRRRYGLLHAHGAPDLLVLCGFLHRLRGTRVLLDLGVPSPERHRAMFGAAVRPSLVRVLEGAEAFSIGCADRVLTGSEEFRRALIGRRIDPSKVVVSAATPGLDAPASASDAAARGSASHDLVCRGSLVREGALDTLFWALARLRREIPGVRLHVLEDPDACPEASHIARALSLAGVVIRHACPAPDGEREIIRRASIGIVPDGRNPLSDGSFP